MIEDSQQLTNQQKDNIRECVTEQVRKECSGCCDVDFILTEVGLWKILALLQIEKKKLRERLETLKTMQHVSEEIFDVLERLENIRSVLFTLPGYKEVQE